jgi:predicted permease
MRASSLFLFAAAFNFVVGGALLFGYPAFAPMLGIEGPPTVFFHVAMGIVLVFGYVYWRIARDPVKYRPYVVLGVMGKMVFVVAIYAHWFAGDASTAMAVLVTGDLVFAALFAQYLRASRDR